MPMYWNDNQQNSQEFLDKVLSQDATIILSFNELERGEQPNMENISRISL
jgi:hypothetical protein